MKIDFTGTGTVEEVTKQADEAEKRDVAASKGREEATGVEGVYDAIGAILTTVDGDRQATVIAQAAVKPDELTTVYIDITLVPTAKSQEARAAADLANVRKPESVPGAPTVAAGPDEE